MLFKNNLHLFSFHDIKMEARVLTKLGAGVLEWLKPLTSGHKSYTTDKKLG